MKSIIYVILATTVCLLVTTRSNAQKNEKIITATFTELIEIEKKVGKNNILNTNGHQRITMEKTIPTEGNGGMESNNKSARLSSSSALLAAVNPTLTFQGINDNGVGWPGDLSTAAGSSHLMTMTNQQVFIQGKSGENCCYQGGNFPKVTLATFWRPLGEQYSSPFDPRIIYDGLSQRWIAMATHNCSGFFSCANAAPPAILIAFSVTDDPTGSWIYKSIPVSTAGDIWLDYPTMGVNKDWISISANLVYGLSNSTNSARVYIIDKNQLLLRSNKYTLGTPKIIENISNLHQEKLPPSLVPNISFDNLSNKFYFLKCYGGTWATNDNQQPMGVTSLYELVGTSLTTLTITQRRDIWTAPWHNGKFLFPQSQLGKTYPLNNLDNKIDPSDTRLSTVALRNNRLYYAHSVQLNSANVYINTSATIGAVQWEEIDPLPEYPVVKQMGRIKDDSENNHYGYPCLAVNANSDILIGYSIFGNSKYISAGYSVRKSSDPLNTMRSSVEYKTGKASFCRPQNTNAASNYGYIASKGSKWGDYSSTVIDPTNDLDFYTTQIYAESPISSGVDRDRWGTWWAKVSSSSIIRKGQSDIDDLVDESELQIMPNPSKDFFNIANIPFETYEVNIIGALGENVFKTSGNTKNLSIDLKSLSSGIYNVVIRGNSDVISKKIIISK